MKTINPQTDPLVKDLELTDQLPAEELQTVRITNSKQSSNAIYLKGLNGIRAIAALAVLYKHIMDRYIERDLQIGTFGVTMFFTLSGFLITYLLLTELNKTNTISIKNFYIRRILRIWPLYFLYIILVVLVSRFVLSEIITFNQLSYYLFFIPNVAFVTHNYNELLVHYWSLGVEEQFYFFWPVAILLFSKRVILFCVSLAVSLIVIRVFVNQYFCTVNPLYWFIYYLRFDCMAIGGLTAYLYFKKWKYIHKVNNIFIQLLVWAILALVCIEKFHTFRVFDHVFIAIVTSILIINQISGSKPVLSLENKVLDHLGKISFGLYVYHPLIILLLITASNYYDISIRGWGYVVFPLASVVCTILVAHLSYTYIESKFLHLKERFATVKSTNSRLSSSK